MRALPAAASLLLAAAALLVPAPAARADIEDSLLTLRFELQSRADALQGTTDATGKKRLKALTKALAATAKPEPSLGLDLKGTGKTLVKLAKVYPEEFAEPAGDGTLGALGDALLQDLYLHVAIAVAHVRDGLREATDFGERAGGKPLAKAEAAVEALPDAPRAKKGALLAKAVLQAQKVRKLLDRDPGPFPGLTVFVDGVPFVPHAAGSTLLLRNASGGNPGGFSFLAYRLGFPPAALSFDTAPVNGTGTVATFSSGQYYVQTVGGPSFAYGPGLEAGGTIQVTIFDPEARTISFTFSITMVSLRDLETTTTITGSYTGSYVNSI